MKKVVILYRVIQHWRAPFFELLDMEDDLSVQVWYGPDFKNTKVVSTKRKLSIKVKKFLSFKIKLKTVNGQIAMPFSPFLFFNLILRKPDVVICEGASNLINSSIAFIYCKIFRKKYIWWSLGKIQGRVYDKKRSFLDKYILYIEKKASRIITYSSVGAKYFHSLGIEKSNIITAVNVIDTYSKLNFIKNKLDAFVLKERYKAYDFVILFVGALIKEKSIDKLLNAQKILESKKVKTGLIIVGDGNYKNTLEKIANKIQLKHAHFVGKKIEDSYKYFSISDIFVLPGLGGLAISEAMCYGLPIITSIGDGCEVDLVTKENGIIDEKMTAEKLAKYIETFINDRDMLKRFGKKSKEIIEHKYNSNNYIKKIKYAIKN